MRKIETDLMPLPRAMYKENRIDFEILEGIFKSVPHSGGYSKKIAKIIQKDVPRKHEERLELIANRIEDPEIRLRWYEQTSINSPKKAAWVPLYQLISDWTRVPQFLFKVTEFDAKEIFQDKGKRQFLVTEKIPALLESTYLAEIAPRKMALFLWGYSEAALWENFNSAQFDSESIISTRLDDSGLDEYCSNVREFFVGSSKKTRELIEGSNKTSDGSNSAKSLEINSLNKDHINSINVKVLSVQLANVKESWKVYLAEIDSLALEASSVRSIQNARNVVQHLEDLTLQLEPRLEDLTNSIKKYSQLFNKTIEMLGTDIVGKNELLVIKDPDDQLDFNEWMEKQTCVLTDIKDSRSILLNYSDLITKLKSHELDIKWEGPFDELATLIEWLNNALKRGERLLIDVEKTELLKNNFKNSSSRYDWNPLIDEDLGPEDWKAICISLDTDSVDPYLIGICLRGLYESKAKEVDQLVKEMLVNKQQDYDRNCKILSALNRRQLENLWKYEHSLRAPIVLCVLNSWVSGLNSYGISTEGCWYWEPLNNACKLDEGKTAYLNESARDFLCCLKAVAMKNPPRSYKNLGRLFKQASEEVNGYRETSSELYELLKKRILTRPNYGGNYGIIANKAYEELFTPLQEAIKNYNISVAKSEFEKLIKNFNFSKWFSQATLELSHFSSIESEHKKKIQQYIDDRLICIQQWLDAESQSQGSQDDNRIELGLAAISLLESSSSREGSENDFLDALGWWVREFIKTEDIPTRPLSYPNEEFVDSLSIFASIESIEFPWRGIILLSNNQPLTLVEYLADSLSSWCNTGIKAKVLKEWQESDRVDYIQIYVQNNELKKRDVNDELQQWVGQRLSELESLFLRDLNEVQLQLGILKSEIKPLLQEEFYKINELLDSNYSKGAHDRLKVLKDDVISALQHYGNNEERTRIVERIQGLGGSVNEDDDLVSLADQYESLLDSVKDRLSHVLVFEKLLTIPNLSLDFQGEILLTINSLKEPEFIPDVNRSEMLKYVLETIFLPITRHLEKPLFLAKEIHSLLFELLTTVFYLIKSPEWVVQEDSEVEKLLVRTSDEIESALDSQDIKRLKSFLISLSDQCVSIGLPRISKDDQKRTETNDTNQYEEDKSLKRSSSISYEKSRQNLIKVIMKYTDGIDVLQLEETISNSQIRDLLRAQKWEDAVQLCVARLLGEEEKSCQDTLLANTALALFYSSDRDDDSHYVIETLFVFLEWDKERETLQFLVDSARDQGISLLGKALIRWLYGLDFDNTKNWKFDSDLIKDAAARLVRVLNPNSANIASKFYSPLLELLSDLPAGKTWSAEYRACLLEVCFKGRMFGALKYLLKKEPIKWMEDRANIFVRLLERATDIASWERLRSFLESELAKGGSKPFSLFAERLDTFGERSVEDPVTIAIIDTLEKGSRSNLWFAVLEITPSTIDPPQLMSLGVPADSPVKFGKDNNLVLNLEGPFLDQQQVRIELNFKESLKGKIFFDTQCRVRTLQEVQKEFIQKLSVDTDESGHGFVAPTTDEIEGCFNDFPFRPMHGEDYIPRDDDEKKIVDILFNAKRPGSLWITSPRRSGKTTMLHWVLDEYSYKKGRDDIILYFSMTNQFDSAKEFNTWIWRRALRGAENRELKKHIPNLEERGISLEKDTDVDIFLSEFAEKLLEGQSNGSRVYFVIDEIDRFAEMCLDGGTKRESANSIMWQLRNLIASNDSVGILFAGSHAAQRFFISEATAPFYNSIVSINLTPFNVDNRRNESRARSLILPPKLNSIYTLTNDTLSHLLRITAGIPYYMKLLAGATFICADHSRILQSDINEGVSRMLAKKTGIKTIDMLDNPGEDELRTLYAESIYEIALIKSVLLTIANIRSPVGGHPVKVGEIWSDSSPLVTRAGLNREIIEPALVSAQKMGFIKKTSTSEYQVEFSIPLLGESLRTRFNSIWASLEPQLMKIAK